MKKIRSHSEVKIFALVVLMASWVPARAHAQETVVGRFTLHFQARWGNTILPAGDYTLGLPSGSLWGYVIIRKEPSGESLALIRADAWEAISSSDSSKLIFERSGEDLVVRALYLRDKGYVF
jgi:hypothetical protein